MRMIVSFRGLMMLAAMEWCISANAEPTKYKSTVKAATLYLSGATVIREAQAPVAPETETIVFNGIPENLEESSIVVRVAGKAVEILSVDYEVKRSKDYMEYADYARLKKTVDSLTLKIEDINSEKAVYTKELAILDENEEVLPQNLKGMAEELEDLVDFQRARRIELGAKVLRLGRLVNALITEKNKTNQDMKEWVNTVYGKQGEITVWVRTAGKSNALFYLEYYTTDAYWMPQYAIRTNKELKDVNLEYDAKLVQTTKEDWKSVAISLSSGNPRLSNTKPFLDPLYARLLEDIFDGNSGSRADMLRNKYGSALNKPRGNETQLETGVAGDTARELLGMDGFTTTRWEAAAYKWEMGDGTGSTVMSASAEGVAFVTFDVDGKHTISGDGKPKRIRVQTDTLPATFVYHLMPRRDKDAFLVAEVTGWEEANLLPADADLFIEDTYVGKTFIDPTSVTDTMTISMGRDKSINVTRVRSKEKSGKSFWGGTIKRDLQFTIKVKNTKSTAISYVIEDQIPLSADKAIIIEMVEQGGAVYTKETGKLKWQGKLEANGNTTVVFGYKASYPKDSSVVGLE